MAREIKEVEKDLHLEGSLYHAESMTALKGFKEGSIMNIFVLGRLHWQ